MRTGTLAGTASISFKTKGDLRGGAPALGTDELLTSAEMLELALAKVRSHNKAQSVRAQESRDCRHVPALKEKPEVRGNASG